MPSLLLFRIDAILSYSCVSLETRAKRVNDRKCKEEARLLTGIHVSKRNIATKNPRGSISFINNYYYLLFRNNAYKLRRPISTMVFNLKRNTMQ